MKAQCLKRWAFAFLRFVYRVYVIQNLKGRFYIGLSETVANRVQQHNDGESKWTKGKGPWGLRWTSDLSRRNDVKAEAMSITNARKLENLLKKQKGGQGFYNITGLTRNSGS